MEPLYTEVDKTLSFTQANFFSTLLIFPILLIFVIPFSLLWGMDRLMVGLQSYFNNLIFLILIILIGILIHEFLHGISWIISGRLSKSSVKYGVKWQYLTPYAHLNVPVRKFIYQIGGLMPGIILGIVPGIIGLIIGSGQILLFGLFFTLAAVGDFIMIWILRDVSKDSLVQDHPDKIGCTILIPQNKTEGEN